MDSKSNVFVIGASGKVGSATLQALSERHGSMVKITAGVRYPEKCKKLQNLENINIVRAEMGDEDGLQKVLVGVDVLFIVTASCKNRVDLTNRTANMAKKIGVKHLVVLSVVLSPLAFSKDTSVAVEHFHQIENHIKQLGPIFTILRVPAFYEVMYNFKQMIHFTSSISLPLKENALYAAISCIDIGIASAEILAHPSEHQNKTYSLLGEQISPNKVCKAFTNVLKKDVKYTQISYEAVQEILEKFGLEDWQIESVINSYRLADAGNSVIQMEGRSDDYHFITGQKPLTVEDWVKHCSSYFLNIST